MPDEGIKVCSLIWAFFLHPGSTNTSNILTFCADMLDELELVINKEWHDAVTSDDTSAQSSADAPSMQALRNFTHTVSSRSLFSGLVMFASGGNALDGGGGGGTSIGVV